MNGSPPCSSDLVDRSPSQLSTGPERPALTFWLLCISYLLKFAGHPFTELSRQDIAAFLAAVSERVFQPESYKKRFPSRRVLAGGTLELHKLVTRGFMAYVNGCRKAEYPECVRWMVAGKIGGDPKIESKDLFLADEITRMIAYTARRAATEVERPEQGVRGQQNATAF